MQKYDSFSILGRLFFAQSLTFNKSADFGNCTFVDTVEFINTDFFQGVSFKNSLFGKYFLLKNINLDDLILSKIQAKEQVYLENVKVQKYASFDCSTFEQGMKLSNSIFGHFVFFDNSKFYAQNKNLHFFDIQNCTFKLTVDFGDALFDCIFSIENVNFLDEVSFTNTKFNYKGVNVSSIGGLKGVNFTKVNLQKNGVINFIGTESEKLFNHEVVFHKTSIEDGCYIKFENANFKFIDVIARESFLELSKQENSKIIIGSGCLKYRLQTNIKTINVTNRNEDLLRELTNSFSSYFTNKNGFNLGVEFLSRSDDYIKLFYFTDEDISEEEFNSRFNQNHFNFLSLLGVKNTESASNELLNLDLIDIEALYNLHFFLGKCNLRMNFDVTDKNEVLQIMEALNVYNNKYLNPNVTINVITNHYTQKTLLGWNTHQEIVTKQ